MRVPEGSGSGSQPGEGIVTKPAMQRLGTSALSHVNMGGGPLPAPGMDALFGGGRAVLLQAEIHTVFGSRSEIHAAAREMVEAMQDQGLAGGLA